ncbi:hypothetical protein NVP1293O_47 [Vibrio phage 1.293.O._10N.261.52.E1]|nr:hypothetical protein NVP1293O_47 [Vibrio phage 1.293.O._10N.261.52.E1]
MDKEIEKLIEEAIMTGFGYKVIRYDSLQADLLITFNGNEVMTIDIEDLTNGND